MKKYLVIAVVVVSVSVGLWKFAQANGANQFNGCVKNTDGSLYLVGNGYPNAVCQGIDKVVTWMKRGPAGPVGPMGPQGPAGTNGTGSSLHLFDANNQDLGIFSGVGVTQLDGKYVTFVPSLNLFLQYTTNDYLHQLNHVPSTNGALYFESNNCTGTPVLPMNPSTFSNILVRKVAPGGNTHYYKIINGPGVTYLSRNIQSRMEEQVGNACVLDTEVFAQTVELQEVILPFTEPLAWPLHIQ